MAEVKIKFEGGMRMRAERRGLVIESDQPEKAGGKDTALPPFDIFVSSLGMCMLLYAAFYIERHGFSAEGLALNLDFEMSRDPSRLGKVHGKLYVPSAELGKRKDAVLRAALACPVHHSLREDIELTLELAK